MFFKLSEQQNILIYNDTNVDILSYKKYHFCRFIIDLYTIVSQAGQATIRDLTTGANSRSAFDNIRDTSPFLMKRPGYLCFFYYQYVTINLNIDVLKLEQSLGSPIGSSLMVCGKETIRELVSMQKGRRTAPDG